MKGWIFDFGGTLDTGGCHWGRMLWHAYERSKVPVTWQQFRQAYVYAERYMEAHAVVEPQHTFRQMLQTKLDLQTRCLCDGGGWATDERHRRDVCRAMLDDVYGRVCDITAMSREVLMRLQPSPMVLVSNFYGNMPVVLREFRLDQLFIAVIESAAVGIRKPDPRIFQMGVQALGMKPEEVTVVGDSINNDIIPARRIGCKTVWMEGEGWDNTTPDATIPDDVITDIRQLLEIKTTI